MVQNLDSLLVLMTVRRLGTRLVAHLVSLTEQRKDTKMEMNFLAKMEMD